MQEEETYTIEDLKELYEASLKFPTESFSSPEFWKGLILVNAVTPGIKALGSERTANLWRQIMKKTHNKDKVFKSMLSDYCYSKDRNGALCEKVANSLIDMFVRDVEIALPDTQTIKATNKRQFSEDYQTVSPSKRLKVSTETRFPGLDLKLIIDKSLPLTERFNVADRELFRKLNVSEEDPKDFINSFKEILKASEDPEQAKILDKKWGDSLPITGSKELHVFRRTLLMFQEGYEKTSQEISDIYIGCSGDLNTMREYLRGNPNVSLWDDDEDEIIMKGSGTAEYGALMRRKGEDEVKKRAEYLSKFAKTQ